MDKRGIQGGDQWRSQRWFEGITRTLDVSDAGSAAGAVTLPTMNVFTCPDPTGPDEVCGPGGADVTLTITSGVMAIAGQIVTLLRLGGVGVQLTRNTNYEIVVGYTKDTNTLGNQFYIRCPDEL